MKTKGIFFSSAALAALMVTGAVAQTVTTDTSATTTTKVGVIGQRKENQQDRIAQGVKSGQLTAGETAHLESKEAALNRETRNMRAANGGTLTAQDKAKVTRQQNRLSRQIYDKKHNARHQ